MHQAVLPADLLTGPAEHRGVLRRHPATSRTKKSGACERRRPSSSHDNQNGCDAMPATAGSKSSNVRWSRSSQDSKPT